MTEPATPAPEDFDAEVAHVLALVGTPHHPAMTGLPFEQAEARAMFRRYARNYGRINRGNYHPDDPDPGQDWTGILLENVYDVLWQTDPALQHRSLVLVAAMAKAWAADIDTITAGETQ
ncbi:hypothetical protein ACIA7S_28655 [Streptomyces sp. NPDC051643]|uniref:hypothetical protein n=1 Tax=Streptomyces sp. NPDC051643 TaxID=3365665 RepID=UPI0037A42E1D